MNDWSNVLDSILDTIPTIGEQPAPATVVTQSPPAVPVTVDLTSDLDFSAPVTPEMLRHAGLSQPAPAENMVKHSFADDLGSLPPIRNHTGKPALPAGLWVNGLPTFAAAWQERTRLCPEYGTAVGQDAGGFFVRCPGWQWVG